MRIEVLADAEAVARRAAEAIAEQARAAIAARGRFTVAISGGRTPWAMLRVLGGLDVPWASVHAFQVDERVAPAGDADRNLTQMRATLLDQPQTRLVQIHAMPVESPDLDQAAVEYARTLARVAGSPPILDLVHLGLGADGHTASLVPNDPVLDVVGTDVAVTGTYQGRRRMTLTYPAIDRSRCVLWLITGADKAAMLARLQRGDRGIPAGRIEPSHALVLADRAAARDIQAAGSVSSGG
jgi:6-phosphogluconolactonase